MVWSGDYFLNCIKLRTQYYRRSSSPGYVVPLCAIGYRAASRTLDNSALRRVLVIVGQVRPYRVNFYAVISEVQVRSARELIRLVRASVQDGRGSDRTEKSEPLRRL